MFYIKDLISTADFVAYGEEPDRPDLLASVAAPAVLLPGGAYATGRAATAIQTQAKLKNPLDVPGIAGAKIQEEGFKALAHSGIGKKVGLALAGTGAVYGVGDHLVRTTARGERARKREQMRANAYIRNRQKQAKSYNAAERDAALEDYYKSAKEE